MTYGCLVCREMSRKLELSLCAAHAVVSISMYLNPTISNAQLCCRVTSSQLPMRSTLHGNGFRDTESKVEVSMDRAPTVAELVHTVRLRLSIPPIWGLRLIQSYRILRFFLGIEGLASSFPVQVRTFNFFCLSYAFSKTDMSGRASPAACSRLQAVTQMVLAATSLIDGRSSMARYPRVC